MLTELTSPIDDGRPWPVAIDLSLRVHYWAGPAEHGRWSLRAAPLPGQVLVSGGWSGGDAPVTRCLPWIAAGASSLADRCLQVLASLLFGSPAMPPRIVGAPQWRSVGIRMESSTGSAATAQIELHCLSPRVALLRERRGNAPSASHRKLLLQAADADPVRALLRTARGITPAAAGAPASGSRPARRLPNSPLVPSLAAAAVSGGRAAPSPRPLAATAPARV